MTWKAFNRKFITTESRRKCRKIVRTCPECQLGKDYRQRHLPKGTIGSSRPWDQERYVEQLKRELEDIRTKLSRILGQEKVISGGPLLDLCGQRSEEEGGNCDASQQQFLFKYETAVGKLPTRPTTFKLAYSQNASNRDKVGFGIKSCKKAKIYRKKANYKFWNPYVYLIMCISMICIYLRKQVNKWQPVELPISTSGFVKLYAKVKMAPETCQMVRKHYDKSNGNFWDIYGYVKIYICMIYMYLTKQVNRLKLVRLPTKTSDLAKLYTIDKFGAESCQMVRKQNHKFHNILWNAYSYLKGRIMEFGKYLRTVILGWRSRRPLATPPGMGYIRRTGIVGCQSGSNHSHPMVSVMSLLLNLLFLFCMHLFRLGYLTVCLINMLYGFVALNLIWLYNCWHINMRLPPYENSRDGKSTDPSCHISLTLASSFSLSLSLSLLLLIYFLSVISHEPGIVGISILGDGLRQLFLVFFEDSLRIPTPVSLVFPYQIGISHVLYLSLLLLS